MDRMQKKEILEPHPNGTHGMVETYVAEVMSRLRHSTAPNRPARSGQGTLAERVFALLTSRRFCYMSRAKTEPYKEQALALLNEGIKSSGPIPFYFDIGPGYHASIHPGETGLKFDVGLSELFVVYQVVSFCDRVAEIYAPGAVFYLVIDNVCALMTNDIPLEKTLGYCARLRTLIKETGQEDTVKVMVESEEFPLSKYRLDGAQIAKDVVNFSPSATDIENVQRFLGRLCDETEALERIAKYKQAGPITDGLFDTIIRGVHMTQRATGSTLGFRPFPGGDSRTQCGEVAITRNSKGTLHPVLLTSRNVDDFECTRLSYPELLPATVEYVTFADRLED